MKVLINDNSVINSVVSPLQMPLLQKQFCLFLMGPTTSQLHVRGCIGGDSMKIFLISQGKHMM